MLPLVSVLMPARNAAAHVHEAIDSLKHQTLSDFEVVLVDDGSEDGTAGEALNAWGSDERLRLLQPGRVGLINALQLGLQSCRSPLVARMDADDIAHPERLAAQVELLRREPEVAVVGCKVCCFSSISLGEGYRRYEQWLNSLLQHDTIAREIFVESPLAHPSVMFRREPVVAAGGYRECGWPEDYDLWLRLFRSGAKLAKVDRVLLQWRDTPNRHSRTHERYSRDAFLRCKAHHLCRGVLPAGRELIIWGAGKVGRRFAGYLQAEGFAPSAFVDIDPRKIGRNLCDVSVLAPAALARRSDAFVLAAVGSRGARELIREQLLDAGRVEVQDFRCVA